jgi:hypothetical protein
MKKKELFLRRGLTDSRTMKREDVQAVESIQEKKLQFILSLGILLSVSEFLFSFSFIRPVM